MSWRMITPAGVTISPFEAIRLVFSYLFCTKNSDKFNKAFSIMVNTKQVWTYAHGRDALFEALKALKGLKPEKDQVLMPVYTCPTVLKSIRSASLTPVLYDIDQDTLGSNAYLISPQINEKTLAVIAGGIFGISINMPEIKNLCKENNIYLIEDVAQSLGCAFGNRHLGTWGDISIYSFGQSKPISTMGGGALTTKDDLIASFISNEYKNLERISFIESLKHILLLFISSFLLKPFCFYLLTRFKNSFKPKHDSYTIRTKKMSALNALIANYQIMSFDKKTEQRKYNAEWIQDSIKNKKGIKCLLSGRDNKHTYLRLPMICDDIKTRDKWIKKLKSKRFWASDLLYEPIYNLTKQSKDLFPLFNSIKDKLIIITTHPYIRKKDIENLKQINFD
jgi:dTDP-4-amino-4,6-dideoxygalactose transaminase